MQGREEHLCHCWPPHLGGKCRKQRASFSALQLLRPAAELSTAHSGVTVDPGGNAVACLRSGTACTSYNVAATSYKLLPSAQYSIRTLCTPILKSSIHS